MKLFRRTRLIHYSGLLLCTLVWLANSGNPPTGRTGAPFDGSCGDCHSGGNFNGNVTVDGLPGSIEPNTTYPLTLTMTVTSGNPTRGGFQLVVVDANNADSGDLVSTNAQTGTENLSNREYLEQRGSKNITGGAVSWTFNWVSPASVPGNTVKFYYIGNFVNGNGGTSGDYVETALTTVPFNGAPPLTATISGTTNVSCFGGNNGTATVEASGGTQPYTYLWSNSQTAQTAVNLTAGTYTVTVTGASGSGTATASTTITQPTAPLTASASVSGVITCFTPEVTATATASGGTQPYSYLWPDGQSGSQAGITAGGVYVVTVTDGNSCTKTASVTVNQNVAAPIANATSPGDLTCSSPVQTLSGGGSSTGANFTYQWTASNGGNIVSGGTTLFPVINACGTYTLVVTNTSNGCTNTASVSVVCDQTPPDLAASNNGPFTCTQTSVTINASSSTSGLSFLWTGPGFSSNLQNVPVSQPGTYSVVATNPSNGCSRAAQTVVLSDNTPPAANSSADGPLTCADTLVQLTGSPSGNFSYAWTGPGGFTSSLQNPVATSAGTYHLQVTSLSNGCTGADSVQVSQNTNTPVAGIEPPARLNCQNITVQINGAGSSQGAEFAYQWTTTNGNIISGETTLTPVVNSAGTYKLVVTNTTNGCVADSTVNVSQSQAVSATTTSTNISCNGLSNGSATAQGNGGNGVFTYQWSNGAQTAAIVNIPADTYQVTVTDGENCSATASVVVSQPSELQTNVSTTGETGVGANDGTATATVTGGTQGYTYIWSNNATTAGITGLAPGNYTVTVTDSNGCTTSQSATVNFYGCNISSQITSVNISCNGAGNGSAEVSVTGTSEAVSYLWSNGSTSSAVSGLVPGTYSVTSTDATGCVTVASTAILEPDPLAAGASSTDETGPGTNDGTASANPTGGTGSYTYIWSTGATTATLAGLVPGIYTVTVTDENNCTTSQSVNVRAFNCNVAAVISSTSVSCPDGNDGSATVNASNGQEPYTYSWSNGSAEATTTGLAVGQYTVTVQDNAGCSLTLSVNISAEDTTPPVLNCPANIYGCGADFIVYPAPTATDNCSLQGPPVRISGQASGTPFNDGETVQVFAATDGSGNTGYCSFSVIIYPIPDILIDGLTNDQNGQGVGTIFITAVGGSGGYLYTWNKNGQFYSNAEDLTALSAGSYLLTITDANGCSSALAPIIITNTVGTNNAENISGVRLWPNPVSNRLNVELNDLEGRISSCVVLDQRGKVLFEIVLSEISSGIEVGNLPDGLYLLRLTTETGSVIPVQFIKSR